MSPRRPASIARYCDRRSFARAIVTIASALRSLLVILSIVLSTAMPAAADGSGSVHGSATDFTTGKPLAGVHVTVASATAHASAVTDASGYFVVTGLAPDTYTITFERSGYSRAVFNGITIVAGQVVTQSTTLAVPVHIGHVTARAGSAFNPNQTHDSYHVTEKQIDAIQGKAFNSDETNLLKSLPSVTLDKSGTISIRGGFAFEAAYQYEGIDYTTPSVNLQNTMQNISNFNMINGVGGVELIPGGGDASHGNTGTGLIQFTAKRGTYPGFTNLDFETLGYPFDHQLGIEKGWATPNGRLSNYFAFQGEDRSYTYGGRGVPASELGTRGTNAATLNTLVDPNLVYFSPSSVSSRDFVDNLIYHFGRDNTQELQFFFQGQAIKQVLDYGGWQGLYYPTAGAGTGSWGRYGFASGYPLPGSTLGLCPKTAASITLEQIVCQQLLPYYPQQSSAYANVTGPDTLYSPFEAFKVQYQNSLRDGTLVSARLTRSFADERQEMPSQGVYAPSYGGDRTGVSGELAHEFDSKKVKQTVEVGGEFNFVRPYGSVYNYVDYGAFTYGLSAKTNPYASLFYYNPPILQTGGVTQDFLTPSDCAMAYVSTGCGYLARYFTTIPRFPAILTNPDVNQQTYGIFLQDQFTIGLDGRFHITPGVRYDGFNFLIPDDPASPPAINGVRHQRQLEPHLGWSYQLTQNDVVAANFGHTLSIPLPSLLGNDVNRAEFAAFAGVPSYDNSTGLAARYCGVNRATLCSNYADQLYWLSRDYLYGSQPVNTALHGATFTNYDFSYEHQFDNGLALKITPFYRRGYDIVEEAASIIGLSPTTGVPVYGNQFYTNDGMSRSTGVEFQLTHDVTNGLSALFGATYINQFGNQPPGSFLSPAALAAGTLYHSPDLSPFQTTLALTYHSRGGIRINPVFSLNVGYPYGAGYYTTAYCNGVAEIVPNTNVISGQTYSPNYVDPENPGTCGSPNIAATRGFSEPKSAGGLLSHPEMNTDLTIEYSPPRGRSTYGMQIKNLFNQIYNTPVFNACYGSIVATGIAYGSQPCNYTSVYDSGPIASADPTGAYNIYPNLAPLSVRFYYQVKL